MRSPAALLLLVVVLSACGSSSGETSSSAPAAEQDFTTATARVEACVDRLLDRAPTKDEADTRRYVRDTYCQRFERNGWIHGDGALSIQAHTWWIEGGTCATGSEKQPTRTVPCEELDTPGTHRINCVLLNLVRRTEVTNYLQHLQRKSAVIECDDGTALAELGVP